MTEGARRARNDFSMNNPGCIRAIAERLWEELRTDFFAPGEIEKLLAARIQIRLDSA